MEYFFSLALTFLFLNNFILSSSMPIFNLATDERALLAFKTAITSDPYAVLSNNWSSYTSICHWIGVSCSTKHHRVTALNVSGFELQGTIAPHIGNLTFLRSLDISSNKFTGFIPSELCNLPRLREINLVDNQITSSIPNGMFNMSSLIEINMEYNKLSGNLPNDMCSNTTSQLKRIYLSGNQLNGEIPANIYKCRELEDLLLPMNHFSGNIPREIGSLQMLRILSLYSNHFKGNIPSSIFNISSLEILLLSNNSLSGSIDAETFHNMLELQELDLSNNNLIGGVAKEVGSLTSLEYLGLLGNNLTGHIPKQIGNLTSLKDLSLRSNYLSGALPQEVGNLLELEVLNLRDNSLSDSIPSSIFNLSTLMIMDLAWNQFSGILPSNMGNSFSLYNLEELYLSSNRLTGDIPSFITSNTSKLTIFSLENNSFSGIMPNFGNLRLLRELWIWGNQLTGAEHPTQELKFLSSLTNCRYLKDLEIAENPLNGILPTSIANLSTSLQYFRARLCNIKGVIPSQIGNLSSLISLNLCRNQLTGSVPRRMGNLMKLQGLYLSYNQLQGHISTDLCGMSNLEELYLGENMLTGPIPDCLGEVKSLRRVYLESNRLDSDIPSNLWNLKDLLTLSLSSNFLSGQLSSQIGNLKAIYELDLSSNQLTGDIPSTIGDCQSLQLLSLSNNKFGGSIPQILGKVRDLKTLTLSNNDLSGSIPKSLEDLTVLEYFDVSYNKLEGEIPNGILNSTAQSFVHNSALCGAPKFQVPPCPKIHGRSRSKSIALLFLKYIVPPFIAATIVVVIILVLIRQRKQIITPSIEHISLEKISWRRISYIELVRGTSSFSETNLLGRGSFGSVFKATLSDGLNVAVKVYNLQLEGATKSFDAESEVLSSVRHRNLVPIIGCCTNEEFKSLILEYMPNGSLEKWLHSDGFRLDLVQRLKIATDVALALEYLHHGHTFPVVHCDVKPSNILLDQDMIAYVGDFGISKLFDQGEAMTQTTTLATIGYAAPEYGSEGKVSTKGDVYSYGILLLEMFTRKKPTDEMFSDKMSLKDWVNKALQENAISEIVAPGLVSTEDQHLRAKEECFSSIFDMAMKCLAFSPDERINMIQATTVLHKIKAKVTAAAEVNNRHGRR